MHDPGTKTKNLKFKQNHHTAKNLGFRAFVDHRAVIIGITHELADAGNTSKTPAVREIPGQAQINAGLFYAAVGIISV